MRLCTSWNSISPTRQKAAFRIVFSEGILQTLIEEGPRALSEPENYDVRANIMWCATMALNGLIGSGVPQDWTTHMIGHEITAMHGLDQTHRRWPSSFLV